MKNLILSGRQIKPITHSAVDEIIILSPETKFLCLCYCSRPKKMDWRENDNLQEITSGLMFFKQWKMQARQCSYLRIWIRPSPNPRFVQIKAIPEWKAKLNWVAHLTVTLCQLVWSFISSGHSILEPKAACTRWPSSSAAHLGMIKMQAPSKTLGKIPL